MLIAGTLYYTGMAMIAKRPQLQNIELKLKSNNKNILKDHYTGYSLSRV